MNNQATRIAEELTAILAKDIPAKHIISIHWNDRDGVEVHVRDTYFDEHFGHLTHEIKPHGGNSTTAQLSYTLPCGATVFCLKYDMYEIKRELVRKEVDNV